MAAQREIPLPVSPFERYEFRAVRERDAIRFEPLRPPRGVNALAVLAFVALVAALAGAYVAIVFALSREGNSPGPWFHVLMVAFAVLLLAAIGFQWRFNARYRGATLARTGAGRLQIRYRWAAGEQTCHVKEPARFEFTLDHDVDGCLTSLDVSEDGSGARKEQFRDRVEVRLAVQGTAIAPRIPFFTKRWHHVAPPTFLYFKELDPEANLAAAVEASRPLAEAVLECLQIPVEIRVFGGPLRQRLEPDTAGVGAAR